ncbi:MAG: DUF1302 domain-containing protein [Desulfobacula sp.]|nr:DUF1302 domain-containing protein [Desulfobacula sp.]
MGRIRLKKVMGFFLMTFLLWFTVIPVGIGTADTAGELEGFEEGYQENDPFENIDTNILVQDMVQNQDSAFKIGGFVKIESEYAYNKNDEKLSRLRPLLFIETAYKINENYKVKVAGQAFYDASYDIEAKDKNKDSNLDDEPYGIELKDLYLDGKLGDIFSVRLGRQIIAWGDSDYARITDVINPRDLTAPGLIDLEDARLPVAALRVSAFFDDWSFDAVTIHEHPGSKISGKGSDFDYYTLLRSPEISINDKQTPDFGIEDTGLAFKVTHAFNGGDISFVVANTFDDQPYLSYNGLKNSVMVFTPEYARMTTYGISSSLAKGSSLFKVETAFRQDKKIMRNDVLARISSGIPASSVRTTGSEDQVSALTGVEYTGFTDLRLSFEAQVIHTLNHQSYLGVDENKYFTYFQATKAMLNETLELALFWVRMNPGNGNILRFSTTYDVFDGLSVQAGAVFYESENDSSDLHPYKDQDRIFVRVKYSF